MAAKSVKIKITDEARVAEYMDQLQHPLKAEIELVRKIIKGADKRLNERIKWNAPSYYYKEDLVTFNPRAQHTVHLVFHHIAIVSIQSDLLEGDYKDRRMVYLNDAAAIKKHKNELERIMKELVIKMEELG